MTAIHQSSFDIVMSLTAGRKFTRNSENLCNLADGYVLQPRKNLQKNITVHVTLFCD